jgi:integrase
MDEKASDNDRTPNTVRTAMTRLSGILQVAVEHGHIPANAVRSLRKVPADPRPDVNPLAPAELEGLVTGLDGRGRAIALLGGHLGLRPLEIRQVPWSYFDGSTLTVSRARTKKSAARTRVIDVPAVTSRELRAWQLESGGRDDDPMIGQLGEDGLRLWAYKYLDPAARKATGRDDDVVHAAPYARLDAALRQLHGPGGRRADGAQRRRPRRHLRARHPPVDRPALRRPRRADRGRTQRTDVPPEFRKRAVIARNPCKWTIWSVI